MQANAVVKHKQTGTLLCPAMLANALTRNARQWSEYTDLYCTQPRSL